MEKDRPLAEAHVEGNHVVHYALEDNHPVEGTLQEGIPKGDIQQGGIQQGGIPQGGNLKGGIQKVGILKVTGRVKCLRTALCHVPQPLAVVCRLLPFFSVF